MSTRALYTFIEIGERSNHIYKHHDGYPSGAAIFIEKSLRFAWELPRFEIDDFAAAFVAANKQGAGDIYISNGQHGDLSYRYEIRLSHDEKTLHIKAFDEDENKMIFEGLLEEF